MYFFFCFVIFNDIAALCFNTKPFVRYDRHDLYNILVSLSLIFCGYLREKSSFIVFLQILMYICRLGVVCSFLSDTLISGFTAGAAIHVFTSQIKDIFGFKIKSATGLFQNIRVNKNWHESNTRFPCVCFFYFFFFLFFFFVLFCSHNYTFNYIQFIFLISQTYAEIFQNVSTINWAATIMSVITILVLVLNDLFLRVIFSFYILSSIIRLITMIYNNFCSTFQPWVSKRCIIPVPIELTVVLVGTIISHYLNLAPTYDLRVVGHISVG